MQYSLVGCEGHDVGCGHWLEGENLCGYSCGFGGLAEPISFNVVNVRRTLEQVPFS